MDNFQVRHICGSLCSEVPFGRMRPFHLSEAKARLLKLRTFATTLEHLSTSAGWLQLQNTLGGQWLLVPRMAKVGARASRPVAPGCAAEVLEHLQLDHRLHQHVTRANSAS